MKRPLLMAAAWVAGLAGIAASVRAEEQAPAFPPARVEVATAVVREMAPVVTVSGTVVSLNDSRIATEIDGVLTWLAEVGASVEAGEVIARIDPRLMQVQFKRATANLARLEAEHRYREQQLRRAEELAARNNASATLLDESRAQRDQALHELADARAQLEHAQGDLARTEIRAAFAGHIAGRLASVGEYLAMGEDVLRLVDTRRIEITLPAPLALTKFVKPGMPVAVSAVGNERALRVRTVVPVGDAVSRMVEVRLDAGDSDWLVGTPVQVSLPSDTPISAIAVPRDALIERGGERFIFVIGEDGTAARVNAQIRMIVGLWVGLVDGIEAGQQVIVRGAERLAPGQPVEAIAASDPQPGSGG